MSEKSLKNTGQLERNQGSRVHRGGHAFCILKSLYPTSLLYGILSKHIEGLNGYQKNYCYH